MTTGFVVDRLSTVDGRVLGAFLASADASGMSANLVPPPLPDAWQVLIAPHGGRTFDLAARLEYEVFLAEGFCEPSDRHVVEEFEPWSQRSVFHAVVDEMRQPIGVVRTLVSSLDDLPVGHLTRTARPSPDPVCEYASLAVAPHARKAGVAEELYRSVWGHARFAGALGLVAIVEPWLYELFRDHYGFAFEPFGPLVWYMGGHVMPIGAELTKLEEGVARRRPELWEWMSAPDRMGALG